MDSVLVVGAALETVLPVPGGGRDVTGLAMVMLATPTSAPMLEAFGVAARSAHAGTPFG